MIFSEIQLTTKFPSAIAINRNAKDTLICVNSNIEERNEGGMRIIIVVKRTAMTMLTINGTIVSL
jgi:hypothetical protein